MSHVPKKMCTKTNKSQMHEEPENNSGYGSNKGSMAFLALLPLPSTQWHINNQPSLLSERWSWHVWEWGSRQNLLLDILSIVLVENLNSCLPFVCLFVCLHLHQHFMGSRSNGNSLSDTAKVRLCSHLVTNYWLSLFLKESKLWNPQRRTQ